MHSQPVTMLGKKRLWIRTIIWLLSGCLGIGVPGVSRADEVPVVDRPEVGAESHQTEAAQGVNGEHPQVQGVSEGKPSGRAVMGGIGAVFLMLGTGVTGGSIYLAANKGSNPGAGGDLASLAKNAGIPLGLAFVAGGLVMIGAAAHRKAR